MAHILLTVVLTAKPVDIRNVSVAVALLIESATLEELANSFMEQITIKVPSQIKDVASKLHTSADFAAAVDSRQAEALLALNKATMKLTDTTLALEVVTASAKALANTLGGGLESPS
ncbi:hypothetical protein C0992_003369 [Termitomyces sp. T32_za158]|nr:hypothetical protein C0992_003369 [Termitomyces sp. T32_za158]